MGNQKEYEKRCKAIQLYKEGDGFNQVLQLVQRSIGRFFKWLRKY